MFAKRPVNQARIVATPVTAGCPGGMSTPSGANRLLALTASPALTAATCSWRTCSTACVSVIAAGLFGASACAGMSGSGPRMSTPYFAAVAMSSAMSGGAGTASTGRLNSRTNRSNPAGAHCRSIRAGLVPMTRKPCGTSRGP
jgi:hypothetical protein